MLIRAQIDPEVRCKIVERVTIKVGWVSRQTFRRIIAPLFCSFRGDPFITFAERGRGGVEKFDQNANAVREVA